MKDLILGRVTVIVYLLFFTIILDQGITMGSLISVIITGFLFANWIYEETKK